MAEQNLKPCPFCGGRVLFDKDYPYEIYHGKCENCTMEFRYEHKEEEISDTFTSGEIVIKHTYPKRRQLNLPFKDAWNMRSD